MNDFIKPPSKILGLILGLMPYRTNPSYSINQPA